MAGALALPTPAAAAGPSFADGAIHCPDGKTIHLGADRAPPSESEQRVDCALNPGTAETATAPTAASVPALTGVAGGDLEAVIDQHNREDAQRKRDAEATEHHHLLAGKFGDWAAFNAALKEGRGDIWPRILGKWAGGLLAILVVLWLLFGRNRAR